MSDFIVGQNVIIKHPVTGERGKISSIDSYMITVDLESGESIKCHQNMVYAIPSKECMDAATKEFKQDPVRILAMSLFEVMQAVKALENRIINLENLFNNGELK